MLTKLDDSIVAEDFEAETEGVPLRSDLFIPDFEEVIPGTVDLED